MKTSSRILLPWLLSMLATAQLPAQNVPVRFQGNLSLSGELYSSSGVPERRPHDATRMIFTPTLTLFDQISLPFEIFVTNQERGFRQPFNQFGVSPRFWGWLTLHAGYFTSRISDLTFGDTRLAGGGIELTPGEFRFSLLYGRSQQAVAADTLLGIRGTYERKILAAKLGYGNPSGWFIDVNFMHAVDDSNSLQLPKFGVASDSIFSAYLQMPTENAIASVAYGMTFFSHHLQIKGETSVSAFTNNIRSPQSTARIPDLASIFTARTSSQADGASALTMTVIPSSDVSVNLAGRWVGPGYVTLGYPQMPNDALELTLGPTVRLFNGTTSLRTSFGVRYNNLRNNRLSTTQRTIANIGATIQPSQAFGLDLQYANYGMRSTPRNDTLRIDNIAQNVMISPRFTFTGLGGTNVLVVNYSLQNFTDYNIVSGNLSSNRTNSGFISWSLAFPSSLSLSTNILYTSVAASSVSTTIKGISESVGHAFFDNLLNVNAALGYNAFTVNATNGQVNGRISASLNTRRMGTFTMMIMSNRFNYSDATAGTSYGEYQGSLMYSIHF